MFLEAACLRRPRLGRFLCLRRDGTQAEIRMYVQSWGKNNPAQVLFAQFSPADGPIQ